MFGKIRLLYFVNSDEYLTSNYRIHKINGKYAIRHGSYHYGVKIENFKYIDLESLKEVKNKALAYSWTLNSPSFENCLGSASKVLKVFKKLIAPPVHYTIEQIYN